MPTPTQVRRLNLAALDGLGSVSDPHVSGAALDGLSVASDPDDGYNPFSDDDLTNIERMGRHHGNYPTPAYTDRKRDIRKTDREFVNSLAAQAPDGWQPNAHVAGIIERLQAQPEKAPRKSAGTFTTAYAIEYGLKQGYKTIVDRERYDYRTKRHHDCEGAVDVIFDDGNGGRIGFQGAGVGERAEHYNRFMAWGGPTKARERKLRVTYLEFTRGNKTPVKVEEWA